MWLKDADCFGVQSWPNTLSTVADFNSEIVTSGEASFVGGGGGA